MREKRTVSALPDSPAWNALSEHYQEMSSLHMRDLFARDPMSLSPDSVMKITFKIKEMEKEH